MPAPNYYLGDVSSLASNLGSMFGAPPTQGTTGARPTNPLQVGFQGGQQVTPGAAPVAPTPTPQQQLVTGSGVTGSGPYNPLGAQAIRPTSFGSFDPQYGQNLATSIGGLFQKPQQNTPLQFNPYGNLTDANVPYPSTMGGNAPLPGLPQTLLGAAQFNNPTALNPPQSNVGAGFTGYDVNGNPLFGATPTATVPGQTLVGIGGTQIPTTQTVTGTAVPPTPPVPIGYDANGNPIYG